MQKATSNLDTLMTQTGLRCVWERTGDGRGPLTARWVAFDLQPREAHHPHAELEEMQVKEESCFGITLHFAWAWR